MAAAYLEYIAAGGNRHPAAADWDSDLLAYGSGHNIALWRPQNDQSKGVETLLTGHTDTVNAVKFFKDQASGKYVLLTGAADKSICIWLESPSGFRLVKRLTEHSASVNTIAVLPSSGVFATGAADAKVMVWRLRVSENTETEVQVDLVQGISLIPRFFPLAIALASLQGGQLVFAVGGTRTQIQVYIQGKETFSLAATLTGHEGWLRSLEFTRESHAPDSDFLLASASQDKYIRLWRFHKGAELPTAAAAASDPALGAFGRSLSNKAHWIGEGDSKHSVTFEALLIGHEDWIYTARWYMKEGPGAARRLLTASADNSLAIWERDVDSGVWTCTTRLGEISAQKGSTSATGSTGGFWVGLWSPDGQTVVSLGRTGSWRMWRYDSTEDRWMQRVGISGHVREVKDIAWSRDGTYLMSTSSDQTTRLYAQWKRDETHTWHEMARPQIHGYDLNCIDAIGKTQFISGADEKLLRVFNKPRAVANLLHNLGNTGENSTADLPEAANIPVLGLSNKAVNAADNEEETAEALASAGGDGRDAVDAATVMHKSTLDLAHPPFEDHLARHTLWPEFEKLYGHGYEISAVAASHDGTLVATACRASSIDHAVIRLYETTDWREVKPVLTAHSLTVTHLSFSPDDKHLLSVGRDRQWALFTREASTTTFSLAASNPKGHSRMILSCSWAPSSAGPVFATAGRDKSVKVWRVGDDAATITLKATIPTSASTTAVSFYTGSFMSTGRLILAYGTETGAMAVVTLDTSDWAVAEDFQIEKTALPSAAVNALRWRPESEESKQAQLAVASDDLSVRLFAFKKLPGQ